MLPSKIKSRAKVISYIYSYLVLEENLSLDNALKSNYYSMQELNQIKFIIKYFNQLENIIKKFLKKDWSWSRINPLEKAILIYGCFELKINDKALVINELVVITRGYIPGDSYKFINAILNNIGDAYVLKTN